LMVLLLCSKHPSNPSNRNTVTLLQRKQRARRVAPARRARGEGVAEGEAAAGDKGRARLDFGLWARRKGRRARRSGVVRVAERGGKEDEKGGRRGSRKTVNHGRAGAGGRRQDQDKLAKGRASDVLKTLLLFPPFPPSLLPPPPDSTSFFDAGRRSTRHRSERGKASWCGRPIIHTGKSVQRQPAARRGEFAKLEEGSRSRTGNPNKPETRNPKPETRNPKPETHDPKRETPRSCCKSSDLGASQTALVQVQRVMSADLRSEVAGLPQRQSGNPA